MLGRTRKVKSVVERFELVFDGDCGLCHACVRWLERHDRDHRITCVTSMQCTWSDCASLPFADTVVVRDSDGRTYLRSSAVAKALSNLPGLWGSLGRGVLFVNEYAPIRRFNDGLYHLVGRNRGAISNVLVRLGLLDTSCRVPSSHKS